MDIQERLRSYIESKNMTVKDFERFCDLGNGTVASICEKSRDRTFEKISEAFPELNIEWVRTGEGEMLSEMKDEEWNDNDTCGRLCVLIDYYSMTNRAFALRCGLKQATFDKQIRRTRAVSLETVEAVLGTFKDVSAEWMVRGEGGMFRGKQEQEPTPHSQMDYDKLNRLVDTIALLQETINEKNRTIKTLLEQVNRLKGQAGAKNA